MNNNITQSVQLIPTELGELVTQFKTANGQVLGYYTLPDDEPEQPRDLVKELNQLIKDHKGQ